MKDKEKKQRKFKIRRKSQKIFLAAGNTIASILNDNMCSMVRRLGEIRDRKDNQVPDLKIKKFEFKLVEGEKFDCSFRVHDENDKFMMEGSYAGDFWYCLYMLSSWRKHGYYYHKHNDTKRELIYEIAEHIDDIEQLEQINKLINDFKKIASGEKKNDAPS